jgi:hypothetical protein
MSDSAREKDEAAGASPGARRFAARQREFQVALATDRLREIVTNERQRREMEQEAVSPTPFYIGLVVIVVLVVAAWLILDHMRCDSFYSTLTLAKRATCDDTTSIKIDGGRGYHQPRLPQP